MGLDLMKKELQIQRLLPLLPQFLTLIELAYQLGRTYLYQMSKTNKRIMIEM